MIVLEAGAWFLGGVLASGCLFAAVVHFAGLEIRRWTY